MPKPADTDATMFWILKSDITTYLLLSKFFLIILAYYFAAYSLSSSDLAPVMTIFPDSKTKAVDFGCLILIIAAANLRGLYSALPTLCATVLRTILCPRKAVDTIFCSLGTSSMRYSWCVTAERVVSLVPAVLLFSAILP